jgi:hypothetical protein
VTTDLEMRRVESSHFHRIAQALISGATQDELGAVKNLVFWRERELKQELVQQYKPGDEIVYLLQDSKTEEKGTIHHLNKLSVSIHKGGGQYLAVPIERVKGTVRSPNMPLTTEQYGSIRPPRFEYVGEHGVDLLEKERVQAYREALGYNSPSDPLESKVNDFELEMYNK